MITSQYKSDILGDGFQKLKIDLKQDYEGEAAATLIRRVSSKASSGVLYIHGFNDYFFQKELAYKFNEHGLNFYALDLRKYGRSYLQHQKFNDIRDLKAYFEEINKAIAIIHDEGNSKVTLIGHSTGGLIVTLYAKYHTDKNLFDGIILNSPFFDFNISDTQKALLPFISIFGKLFPKIKMTGGFSEKYGQSIHKKHFGEWDYDLDLKPNLPPKVNLGWLRAVYQAQHEIKKEFHIDRPLLIMHSSKYVTDPDDMKQISSMDSILNINHIKKISKNIIGDMEIKAIDGGLHDLILSKKEVRENVYNLIFEWMKKKNLF